MRDKKLLAEAKSILSSLNQDPKKSLGQNFLVDKIALEQIAKLGNISKNEQIVEIGPGFGWLTSELLKYFPKLTVVEKDDHLAKYLNNKFAKTINLIHKDILDEKLFFQLPQNFKLIANIPYSITTPLLQKIITIEKNISRVVLLVQKEVADRLSAKAGSAKRGAFTVALECFGDAKTDFILSPNSFWPSPNVESRVLIVENIKGQVEKKFIDFLYKGFCQKRKKITNSLGHGLSWTKDSTKALLDSSKIALDLRPEDLSLGEWLTLWHKYESMQ